MSACCELISLLTSPLLQLHKPETPWGIGTPGALYHAVCIPTPDWTAGSWWARPKSISFTLSSCCWRHTTIMLSGLRSACTRSISVTWDGTVAWWKSMQAFHGKTPVTSVLRDIPQTRSSSFSWGKCYTCIHVQRSHLSYTHFKFPSKSWKWYSVHNNSRVLNSRQRVTSWHVRVSSVARDCASSENMCFFQAAVETLCS